MQTKIQIMILFIQDKLANKLFGPLSPIFFAN